MKEKERREIIPEYREVMNWRETGARERGDRNSDKE